MTYLNLAKLKLALFSSHTSQRELAKLLGIDEKTMSLKMTKHAEFSLKQILKVCDYLNIQIEAVLSSDNKSVAE